MSNALVMEVRSPRYGQTCAKCSQRVRLGKVYVISPTDSNVIFHKTCAPARFT